MNIPKISTIEKMNVLLELFLDETKMIGNNIISRILKNMLILVAKVFKSKKYK